MADGGTLKEKGEMGRGGRESEWRPFLYTATIGGKEGGGELQCAISLFYSNPSFFLSPFSVSASLYLHRAYNDAHREEKEGGRRKTCAWGGSEATTEIPNVKCTRAFNINLNSKKAFY